LHEESDRLPTCSNDLKDGVEGLTRIRHRPVGILDVDGEEHGEKASFL